MLRLVYRGGYWAMRGWSAVLHPRRRGVKCVLRDGAGRIVWVRHTYGDRGAWELPGGAARRSESPVEAARREAREELGVDVEAIELMAQETHLYPHGLQVVLSFIRCTAPTGTIQSLDGQAFRWVLLADVDPNELLEADRPFVRRLIDSEGVGDIRRAP